MLYLTFMETTTSTMQQFKKVEQPMQQPTSYCHLLELVILVITQQNSVVQSTHQTMFYSLLREPNNFINNSAEWHGGAIYITKQVMLTFNGTNNFIVNSADNDGGVIYSSNHNILTLNGTNNFIGNSSINNGGAIYTWCWWC